MKIISTNIGSPTTIVWNGKTKSTGIYKYPVDHPLYLHKTGVKGDHVADLKVHGGVEKACYLFGTESYPRWKQKYQDLDWDWGMFGENLTIDSLDERELIIGDTYRLGEAIVEIGLPREPCYKFGIRMGSQKVIEEFIEDNRPGTYVKILQEGSVQKGDKMELLSKFDKRLSIWQFFHLLFAKDKDQDVLSLTLEHEKIPDRKKAQLRRFVKEKGA